MVVLIGVAGVFVVNVAGLMIPPLAIMNLIKA